jgi:hypothetical protein
MFLLQQQLPDTSRVFIFRHYLHNTEQIFNILLLQGPPEMLVKTGEKARKMFYCKTIKNTIRKLLSLVFLWLL